MKPLLVLAFLPALLAQIQVKPEDKEQILSNSPERQQLMIDSQIQSAQARTIEALNKEIVRLKTCLRAGVTFEECGALSTDGQSVTRIAKPDTTTPKQ